MQKTKKILTIAFAAVALTTSSLAITGQAYAKGGGKQLAGGGVTRIPSGGRHFAFTRGIYFSNPGYVSCWRWIGGKRVFVCY